MNDAYDNAIDDRAMQARIEAEIDRRLRRHSLQQVHEALQMQRDQLKALNRHLPALPDETRNRVATFIVNELESLMWQIETTLREEDE